MRLVGYTTGAEIHEKLDRKRRGIPDIAILKRQRAQPHAEPAGRGGGHEDEQRKKDNPRCRG